MGALRRVGWFVGSTIGGAVGWWAGAFVGQGTAFFASVIGTGIGLYYGVKWAKQYSD